MPELEVIRPDISKEEYQKRLKDLEAVLSSILKSNIVLVKKETNIPIHAESLKKD